MYSGVVLILTFDLFECHSKLKAELSLFFERFVLEILLWISQKYAMNKGGGQNSEVREMLLLCKRKARELWFVLIALSR